MICRMPTVCLLTLPLLLAGCADSGGPPANPTTADTSAPTQPDTADAAASDTSAPATTPAAELPADKPSSSDHFSTPAQAVQTMVAAAQAGDADLLGSCFAKDAPGEFQAFRAGTATAKQIDEFKEFAQEAKVGEAKLDASGKKAVVQVQFKRRAEELNVVKTEEGWKVLDF